ncbi:MAG TPA: hypothetical protein DCZ03_07575 [Gammaproteobacteria bacterium]|nr:hypothetical protein [Gammaproteobacteria bacterium]
MIDNDLEENYDAQINAFIIDGKLSGTYLRVDQSLIICGNSELPPLGIVDYCQQRPHILLRRVDG